MLSRVISRRLLGALVVSLLLHWVFVSGKANWLPDLLPDSQPIEVSLAPPQLPTPAPIPTPEPEVKPEQKPVTPKPSITAKPAELPPTPPPPLPAAPAETLTPVTAAPEPPPVIEQAQAEPLPVIEDEPTLIPPAPKKVAIEFAGYKGSKGSGKQTFTLGENGHYTIVSELSIPVFIISASIEQRSEGLITETGLQPSTYRQKVTSKNPQIATFDWVNKKVSMDSGKRVDVAELPAATQDRLSFMYQFMFVPPLNEMRLSMTDGKKLKSYLYEFEGEDTLSTKMGDLRTWHIAKASRDNDAKTELWLALDYRHLPVRIRVTEKDGSATDLIVSNLKIEQ
jgi:hypothetical protein